MLKNRLNDGKYRIFTIGSFLGNVGFFGQPLISALIPTEPIVSGYCMLFATSMNLLIFTVGEFMITRDRKYISIRRTVINPTVLSVFVAVPLYLMNIKLPSEIQSVLLTLRAMAAPICMLILGLRLASMKLKEVFTEPFAYLVSAMKLLVFPLFAYALVYFLPWFDSTFKTSVLIISGTPCAAVIQSLSELHGSEQKNAAYTVLISSILCAVTLPLLALILL